ncbi:hypothetical protein PVAG01_09322 [Phlyctema vagabunda]|uniref:Uncharacterized protein n=1 Tax=Phlyctema vagabunda TaxID=108571 RepID=A0ABR4P722_9HELO
MVQYTQFEQSRSPSIKDVYRFHPEAVAYYDQLIDYIATPTTDSVSFLQSPKSFEISAPQETASSPSSAEGGIFPFHEVGFASPRNGPRITTLEGFPSPQCIALLGVDLKLRPELFLGHLEISIKQTRPLQFYEWPPLPSKQDEVLQIRLASLRKIRLVSRVGNVSTKDRARADASCREDQVKLFTDKKFGASRMRNIYLHNSTFSSAEELISFSIASRDDGPWEAAFLLDRASPARLQGHPDGPTLHGYFSDGKGYDPYQEVPLIPYNHKRNTACSISSIPNQPEHSILSIDQFHPLKNVYATDAADLKLLNEDPFYILSSVLSTAATSWLRVLNLLEEDVKECQDVGLQDFDRAIEQLRFDASLLERTETVITQHMQIITTGGCRTWPKTKDPDALERKAEIQRELKNDHQHVLSKCASLVVRCRTTIDFLVSTSQLIDAQKGIVQANQVASLTRLAFVFIPLSLMAAIFGMNVEEMKDNPPIWLFFATAFPLSLAIWLPTIWRELCDWVKNWWQDLRHKSKHKDVRLLD